MLSAGFERRRYCWVSGDGFGRSKGFHGLQRWGLHRIGSENTRIDVRWTKPNTPGQNTTHLKYEKINNMFCIDVIKSTCNFKTY